MLDIIRHDDILELRLARPPVNALDPALVKRLRRAVESAPQDGARGIVLSGRPGMFSAGLDVPVLLQLDRAALIVFWRDFFGLCAALAGSPVPVAAAIGGHSPAGGAVLAIFCDYRIMARSAEPAEPFRIGLNEVQVGLSVPEPIQFGLRRLLGRYQAERLLVAGAMLDSQQAHAVGFVDELTDADHVVERALAWLGELLNLPPQAMSATRAMSRADLVEQFSDPAKLALEDFADAWFGDETQATLHALVERLGKS